jgi:hypothetical protein
MKIIITESQKESLDYYQLSNCVKRRIDLDGVDDIVDEAMEEFVSLRSTTEGFIDMVINYTCDIIDKDYGVEKCWGDEYWDEFSAPIKRFLSSRYESKLKEYFENYYN